MVSNRSIQLILILLIYFIRLILNSPLCMIDVNINKDKNKEILIQAECNSESGEYSDYAEEYPNRNNLKILEYNVDKSGNGGDSPNEKGFEAILEYITFLHSKEDFDVIVLIEVASDCPRWKVPADALGLIAKKLNMNYVYGVEFFLPGKSSNYNQCTIGNAIFSKYTLLNQGQLIFSHQESSFTNQIGKRLAVYADIRINAEKLLRIYAVHLESGNSKLNSIIDSFKIRSDQTNEIIEHIKQTESDCNNSVDTDTNKYPPKYSDFLLVGDFNSPFISYDYSISELYKKNFNDAFSHLWFYKRITCPFNGFLSKMNLGALDYIFSKYNGNFENSRIYNDKDEFYGLSDHLPICTTYIVKE